MKKIKQLKRWKIMSRGAGFFHKVFGGDSMMRWHLSTNLKDEKD